jgi:hypothetical protein
MSHGQSYGSFQFVNSGVWQLPLYKTCVKKGLIFDDWSGKLSADLALKMENGAMCIQALAAAEGTWGYQTHTRGQCQCQDN